MGGVALSAQGRDEARRLAERFAKETVSAIHASPLERALETAEAIAQQAGLEVEVAPAITEIDFGQWTGESFEALKHDPAWSLWNAERGRARPPSGESMGEAQGRIVDHMDHLRARYPGGSVVLVSHCDVIKAALLHFFGLPLEAYDHFDIAPASVSTLVMGEWGSRLLHMNERLAV